MTTVSTNLNLKTTPSSLTEINVFEKLFVKAVL